MNSTERAPQIGYWWCFCCEHDLYEIETQADIDEVLATREHNNSRVWETRDDALMELVGKVITDEEIAARP
jgi:hypothetical protein